MEEIPLINVSIRDKNARLTRDNSKSIPGILYNRDYNVKIQITQKDLSQIMDECIYTRIFTVNINNQTHKVKFMCLQRDPVSSKVIHFDLKIVNNEILHVSIPVFIKGIVPTNYKIKIPNRAIKAKCTPDDLVPKLEFTVDDITKYKKISTDTVKNIKTLDGISFTKQQDIVITKINK